MITLSQTKSESTRGKKKWLMITAGIEYVRDSAEVCQNRTVITKKGNILFPAAAGYY